MADVYTPDWYDQVVAAINTRVASMTGLPPETLHIAVDIEGDGRSPYVDAASSRHFLIRIAEGHCEWYREVPEAAQSTPDIKLDYRFVGPAAEFDAVVAGLVDPIDAALGGVIKVRGERARWFGAGERDANVDSDAAWLAIGIYQRASKDWTNVSKDLNEQITAYTAGWNAHLKAVGAKGVKGWCSGAAWLKPLEPVDVYAYARSIALTASSARLARYIPTAHPPTETASVSPDASGPGTHTTLRLASTQDPAAPSPATGPVVDAAAIGSNGWAIGKDRSADGRGMLVANPHFPWEGELRFWEAHLTVPGQIDAYGVTLSGLPGLGIGSTKTFGWTHTVSAGNRFTAYRLSLVPGQPTKYRYGDQVRDLVPSEHAIEVLGDDGKVSTVTRTTLPQLQNLTEDASRTIRRLDRIANTLGENPQALLYGSGAIAPGPGEPGFVAPAATGMASH